MSHSTALTGLFALRPVQQCSRLDIKSSLGCVASNVTDILKCKMNAVLNWGTFHLVQIKSFNNM